MRGIGTAIALFGLATSWTGCNGDGKNSDADDSGLGDSGDSGDGSGGLSAEEQALLDTLQSAMTGYETWDQLGDHAGIEPRPGGPHGDYIETWLNSSAYDTVQAGGGTDMPAGAVLVKQGYDDEAGAQKRFLTAMMKDASYGWFWVSWNNAGDIAAIGQPSSCVSCHSAGQDMVRITSW